MSKSGHQKLKLLYLRDFLLKKTDEEHCVSMAQILEYLAQNGIGAERKSIYNDFIALEQYGLDVMRTGGKGGGYRVGSREFELSELKLLVDAVQSCRFLSSNKSRSLIHKLEGFASEHEARDLQRQVFVANRVKSMNESVYYNIDALHAAIAQNKQIAFRYYSWTVKKVLTERRENKIYHISPYALAWRDENYYLVGYDSAAADIRHFRVDKMRDINILGIARDGKDFFDAFDLALYLQKTFGMFGGREETVMLQFENNLAGVVIDRFGTETTLIPVDETHFKCAVIVCISPQFFGWIVGCGNGAKILSPPCVAEEYATLLRENLRQME